MKPANTTLGRRQNVPQHNQKLLVRQWEHSKSARGLGARAIERAGPCLSHEMSNHSKKRLAFMHYQSECVEQR